MKHYRVVCERSGDWWAIHVPELRGVFTQARRLDKAETVVKEAIGLFLDVEPNTISVTLEPVVPGEGGAAVREARERTAQAAEAERLANSAVGKAIGILRNAYGLTTRDAGQLLGVSHQRISQIATATQAPAVKPANAGTPTNRRTTRASTTSTTRHRTFH